MFESDLGMTIETLWVRDAEFMNNICNKINNKFWHDLIGSDFLCLLAKKAHKVLMNTHSSVLFLLVLHFHITSTYILRKIFKKNRSIFPKCERVF